MARAALWDDGKTVFVECPGCGMGHALNIDPNCDRPRWTFNGNLDRPTLSPSILCRFTHSVPSAEDPEVLAKIRRGEITQTRVDVVCHSFVRDGQIEFLGDCTHALAGKTVDLPEVED